MTTKCQLAFLLMDQIPSNLLASVRFTCYSDEGQVTLVEQINYSKTKQSREELEDQIIASLECAVDVAMLAGKEITSFPRLHKYIDEHQSIG